MLTLLYAGFIFEFHLFDNMWYKPFLGKFTHLKVIKYASFSKKDWPSLFPDLITYVGSNVFQAPV